MVSMEMDHDVTKVDIHFWILKNQRAIRGRNRRIFKLVYRGGGNLENRKEN